MHKQLLSGILFAFAIAAATPPAFAADMPIKSPPPQLAQPKDNWSGWQVGVAGGTSYANNNFVEPGAYICPAAFPFGVSCFETPFAFGGHPLTATVGPFLGYRWQFGNSVLGVEGDWSWKKAENSLFLSNPAICFNPGCFDYRADAKSGSVKQDWDSSLRLRYGWLVNPSTLVYGTAGVAVGQISGSFTFNGVLHTTSFVTAPPVDIVGSTATANASWSDIRVGGTVGAGLETALWGTGWKIRAEYRYTDFGSYTKTVAVNTVCVAATGCSAPSSSATINLKESFHTVRVGVGFDF